MDSEYTIAILRDIYVVCLMALGVALPVYAYLRVQRGLGWNTEGNVLSRPFEALDGVGALILLGLLVSLSLAPQAKPPTFEEFNTNSYAGLLFLNSAFLLLVAGAVVLYLMFVRGMNPAEMFGLRQMPMLHALMRAVIWLVLGGLLLSLLLYPLYEIYQNGVLKDEEPQTMVKMFQEATNPLVRIVIVVAAVIFAPLAEEVIFRGYLYGVTKRYTERWFATLFTAVLFACVHVHLGSFLPLMLLGILFALAYEQTGSLLVPIFMHALFNGFNVIKILNPNLGA